MFVLAVILGCYAYVIFFLGLSHLLYKQSLLFVSVLCICSVLLLAIRNKKILQTIYLRFGDSLHDKKIAVFFLFLLLMAMVNLIGVLGPELSFDALWYHLTLPKLYLLNHKVFFIHGNLLYYSAMPQLTEMYYAAALALTNEIVTKIIHFSFGILSCTALFFLARKLLNTFYAVIVVVVFYANLVVGWESITAFIDLTRTFFEIMALWGFVNWIENKKIQWAILSGIMVGFASGTKLLSLGSIIIFLVLFCILLLKSNHTSDRKRIVKAAGIFGVTAFLVVSPWLFFAYHATGNPVYPFFSPLNIIEKTKTSFTLVTPFVALWKLFVAESDPILPIYLIMLPLLFVFDRKRPVYVSILLWYSGLSLLIWYILPKIGGGRFVLPYLPAYSLLIGYMLFRIKDGFIRRYVLSLIVFLAVISLFYRAAANAKYLPVLLGKESKHEFLSNHLNFSFGDFYDTDNFFATHIKSSDVVLLYGFHNLYYVNFPFIHDSWAKKGDRFNYIAVQNGTIPKKFSSARLIHVNPVTHVKVYAFDKFITYQ